MILVTDVNGHKRYLNSDLIESIEQVPETLIILANGHRHMVRESPEEVTTLIVDFRRRWFTLPPVNTGLADEPPEAPTGTQ
ncbi:MAG: hypothetical protein A3K19_31040 [Lentisphaerae bacterium RIFOXYB12_FULL_65_16]|nr:MAG: hypothetical protein A3K18_26805 [Lentisphaerae bacterium RIFOXYA12_64_32]OGV88876.1 MAG: hypothetical protein A3K19_31040 [Lentisphaerae bacterium RIFOXYB12_FULL_65_16]